MKKFSSNSFQKVCGNGVCRDAMLVCVESALISPGMPQGGTPEVKSAVHNRLRRATAIPWRHGRERINGWIYDINCRTRGMNPPCPAMSSYLMIKSFFGFQQEFSIINTFLLATPSACEAAEKLCKCGF